MKQKFIEWFTKNNNGCSPAMDDDRSFVHEKTQHMLEAYQAGVAEGEARCAALAAENAGLKSAAKETLAHWAAAEPGEMEKKMDKCMPALRVAYCETPATDAFLAEVRAQGVELMVEECESDIMLIEPEDEEHYTLMIEHAKEFAAQLRKGVQS